MLKLKCFFFLISIEIFSSLLLDKKSRKEDYMVCNNFRDSNKCTTIELEHKDYQCCKLQEIIRIKSTVRFNNSCDTMFTSINITSTEISSEKGKRALNEFYIASHLLKGQTNITSEEKHFECQDGKTMFTINNDYLSEEEKDVIKSNNYCLRFMFNNSKVQPNQDDCFNSILTNKSQELDLKCGYYEFDIQLTNKTLNYKTCFIWDDDIAEKKSLGYLIKSNIELLAMSNSENTDVSEYVVRISKSKDKTYKYDSITGNVVEESNASNYPNYHFLTLKFFSILILLYL